MDPDAVTLSVVTVVRNDRHGLMRTFRSLKEQFDADFEWVVIDGASTDGTAELIAEIADERTTWTSEPDGGIYDAMNRGVRFATGTHILFLNAGDVLVGPNVMTTLRQRVDPDLDLLFADAYWSVRGRYRIARPARPPAAYLWRGLPALHQSTLFRRRVLEQSPFDLSYKVAADYALVAELVRRGARSELLEVPIAGFDVGGTSFQRPFQLMMESNRVRREILGLPRYVRLWAWIRTAMSIAALRTVWFGNGLWLKGSDNGKVTPEPRAR